MIKIMILLSARYILLFGQPLPQPQPIVPEYIPIVNPIPVGPPPHPVAPITIPTIPTIPTVPLVTHGIPLPPIDPIPPPLITIPTIPASPLVTQGIPPAPITPINIPQPFPQPQPVVPEYIPITIPAVPLVTQGIPPTNPVAPRPPITIPTIPAVPLVTQGIPPPIPPPITPINIPQACPGCPEPLPWPLAPIDPIPQPTIPAIPPRSTQIAQPPAIPVDPSAPGPQLPAPPGMTYGAHNQLCEITSNAVCQTPQSSAFATAGFMYCEADFSCCLCREIVCNECVSFRAGPSAVAGVKSILINGRSQSMGGAASIICQGTESCQDSIMFATNILYMVVTGDMGMKNGKITITNPQDDFKLYCEGLASCEGLNIEIIIPPPEAGTFCSFNPFRIGAIDCSGQESCKNMQLTIRNSGCNKVLVEQLICTEIDSCLGAHFNFIGDVETVHCDLGPSGHTASGLSSCYQNLQALLCQDPNSCRGIRKTLTNPHTAFTLECGETGSCQSAQLILNFDTRPWMDQTTGNSFMEHTEWIDGFKFSGEASGALATIVINNNQAGKTLQVEKVECVALNACAQMTIITGPDVEIVEILCLEQTCDGCLVKVEATDVGVPCSTFAQP